MAIQQHPTLHMHACIRYVCTCISSYISPAPPHKFPHARPPISPLQPHKSPQARPHMSPLHPHTSPHAHTCRCSGCKVARYLDRQHQARAWQAGHKQECRVLQGAAPHIPPATMRLLLRTLLARAREQAQHAAQQQAQRGSGGISAAAAAAGAGKGGGGGRCGGGGPAGERESLGTASPSGVGSPAAEAPAARFEDVHALQHHWHALRDEEKINYAQMAAMSW